jgi:hypothetical protein
MLDLRAEILPGHTNGLGITGIVAIARPCNVTNLIFGNDNAAMAWAKIYDIASEPTSATIPAFVLPIPGGTGGSFVFPQGLTFNAGLAWRATANRADDDNNAPAGGISANYAAH